MIFQAPSTETVSDLLLREKEKVRNQNKNEKLVSKKQVKSNEIEYYCQNYLGVELLNEPKQDAIEFRENKN